MGQEFFINSQLLEDQVRKLLPSQGGQGAGFDLSASTQIIPVIDLTESAEGSNLRSDLQTAFSKSTSFNAIAGATTTIISNTGYFRVFGTATLGAGNSENAEIRLNDGTSNFTIYKALNNSSETNVVSFDFIVFLSAGDTCLGVSSATDVFLQVSTRQIATIDNILVNP